MPEKNYEEAKDQLKSHIDELNDVIREVEFVDSEEREEEFGGMYIITAKRNEHFYTIYLPEEDHYGTLRYPYDFIKQLSNNIDEESATDFLEKQGVDRPDQSVSEAAAEELLNTLSDESMDELAYKLSSQIESPHAGKMIRWENDAVVGFDVYNKIFPYDDNFSLEKLERAIQVAVSKGRSGADYLRYSFNYDRITEESDQDTIHGLE